MRLLLHERWPLVAGVVASPLLLVVFGLSDGAIEWDGRPLGIAIGGWGVALLLLSLFLALQLLLNGRISLRRERRLVETGAALREASAQLARLATIDTLTGLLNRRVFDERLGVEFRRSQRYRRPLSLLMIDLDHFKRVNDEHGHPYGDFVLAETARSISDSIRESDVAGRYGGEEFVVMLPETEQKAALTVADKLRAEICGREFRRDGVSVRLTFSVGIAALPATGMGNEADLISRADEALYEAKRLGRDRAVVAAAGPAADAAAHDG